MFRKWFVQTVQKEEEKVSEKTYPYHRITSILEELSEADVDLLENYIANLKQRKPVQSVSKNPNQRTKGQQLKSKQKERKRNRNLNDEIQEARDKLKAEQLFAQERRTP
ncbi:hypothetical protein HO929_02555 [Streptococcus suis]|uniref:hypothetical protein n=1 Tax=Streptococcus suis TaxID=1307 RepID=UPI0010A9AAFA|nr:hypothetical protein [Streptococcus suis]MBM7317933.1 hypothetical protein [Streptococcus suis]MBY4963544.1 hypothetical protein [Streptococcus suis]NQP28864.1 hypothetical protein [Streptococcus suis]TII10982.1 hypothetical protein FAJ40_01870 [Streptococcus suis]